MKKHTHFITMLILFFLGANVLLATSFKGEQNITISTEVNEDLYLAGGNILIDAPVRGDLICAGGDVTIQDTISEDVLLVGGTLKLMGFIGDDVRVAGGTITITNNVKGDLIVAGGDVTVSKDAVIEGNLHVVGGKLTMNGTVMGMANMAGGEIFWNGIAENELTVKGGNLTLNGTVRGKSQLAANNITLGDNAKLYNNVEYWNSSGDLDFGNSLLNGATSTYNEGLKVSDKDFNWRYLGIGMIAFWVYRLLVAALIIILLIWMFHRFFTRNSPETYQNYASHLGYGFLYVIGLPVLIIITFVTVIGIPVGLIMMTTYGMSIALGHILASLLIAYGWNAYYEKHWNRRTLFFVALLSYLALKILGAIPFLGFVISILIVTTAFGTILYIWWKSRPSGTPAVME